MAYLLSIANFMLALLLVSANAAGLATSTAAPDPYALVVFQWPMALCMTSRRCQGLIPTEFRLHGVWPTDGHGNSMMHCTTVPYRHSTLKYIEKDLHVFWKSFTGFRRDKDFWKHEWEKHGTCSHQSVLNYFTNSLNLFKKNYKAIYDALEKAGLRPSNNTKMSDQKVPRVKEYYDAIDKYLNMVPIIKCTMTSDKKRYMLEIHLCATADLKSFRNCSLGSKYRGCGRPSNKALYYKSPKMGSNLIYPLQQQMSIDYTAWFQERSSLIMKDYVLLLT